MDKLTLCKTVIESCVAHFHYDLKSIIVYENTTCQFQIKFITEDYLQLYKYLQLFTNTFTLNINICTGIKVIKSTYIQTQSY